MADPGPLSRARLALQRYRESGHWIPTPGPAVAALLRALEIHLPEALPHTETPDEVTRKKLPEHREQK